MKAGRSLLAALICCCLLAPEVKGCLNGYDAVPGVFVEEAAVHHIGEVIIDKQALQAFLKSSANTCATAPGERCNDRVIALLFAEQFDRALELSSILAARFPDEYNVRITHAVALELKGNYNEALQHMDAALALNPEAHKGSEWIHRNILLQRIAGHAQVDPKDLIGVDLRAGGQLHLPEGVDGASLLAQVHYQVSDRMHFTPEHDPLFGTLLMAYADLLHLNKYRKIAKEHRELALRYGFDPMANGPQEGSDNADLEVLYPEDERASNAVLREIDPKDLGIAFGIVLMALGAIVLWAAKSSRSKAA